MAYSTQKDFFHVPFMNENVELTCPKACAKIKSYESTIDDRAWATDEAEQSKFLSDLATCQFPVRCGSGEGDFSVLGSIIDSDQDELNEPFGTAARQTPASMQKGPIASGSKAHSPHPFGKLTAGDSLLQCANIHLADYQKLMKIKSSLEKELEISNERLHTAKEENRKIREIIANKLDSNAIKDFFNKIQKLTTNGKLNKNEENELLQIYQKMENMNKSYEILQAENNYLKRLIEKLSERVKMENIITQPEKSNDVSYLQNELNKVRKECMMLRQLEDEYLRLKQHQSNKISSLTEEDTENIKAILKERNSLREKCKSLKALEQQVEQLKNKAQEAQDEANELSSNLNIKSQRIDKLAGEMQNMQKYYEEQNQSACFKEEVLKAQLEDLKDDLIKAKCQAQRADMLAMEVSSLRNELLKRDLALNDYDCQYKQLMEVVNELQSMKLQCLQDDQTQTLKDETDELAFYTCATLDHIIKELKRKGCFNDDEFMAIYGLELEPNESNRYYDKQCCREMHRLQQEINEMKNVKQEAINCEAICADALKRLKELETENMKLLQENHDLNEKLLDGEVKMGNMLRKIEHLDKEINKNGQEAHRIGKELEGTKDLVKNISDVQLKNQQLANAVSAINSRDDQKIIDDLRRQLEEEMAKLKKCQMENTKLQEEAKAREMDLKQLKERNNKLETERKKLEKEYNIKIPYDEDEDKPKSKRADDKNKDNLRDQKQKFKKSDDEDADESGKIPYHKTPSKYEEHEKEKDKEQTKPLEKFEDKSGKSAFVPSSKDTKAASKPTSKDTKHRSHELDVPELLNVTDFDDTVSASETLKSSALKDSDKKSMKSASGKKTEDVDDHMKKSSRDPLRHIDAKSTTLKTEAKARDFKSSVPKESKALDEFVTKKSTALKTSLVQGRSFENEFRNILEDFMYECGYCFTRMGNTKSKLYAICHKLYHRGIHTLSFRELAYLHKKIYGQAEQLLPGCLLDMIITDHKDQVENMLTSSMVMPRLGGGGGGVVNNETKHDADKMNTALKCCSCRSELCCTNSEEMLKDKVNKLEKDIVIAREYLETLRNIPTLAIDNGDSSDTNNSTFRASSSVTIPQKLRTLKYHKKLKSNQTHLINI
ncbi:uncharacterized protein ACRADG_008034 [Cochliomyia hominivorax]